MEKFLTGCIFFIRILSIILIVGASIEFWKHHYHTDFKLIFSYLFVSVVLTYRRKKYLSFLSIWIIVVVLTFIWSGINDRMNTFGQLVIGLPVFMFSLPFYRILLYDE